MSVGRFGAWWLSIIIVIGLNGCTNRSVEWLRITQNGGVTFFAPVSCGTARGASVNVIGDYRAVSSIEWNGGIPDVNPQFDPRMKERLPGNYYAFTLRT